jgi:hypothetical protein
MKISKGLLLLAGVLLGPSMAASAQVKNAPVVNPAVTRVATERAAMTAFDPAVHGFKFANTFSNNVLPEFDYRTDGLCAGMVFATLDYYRNPSVPLPTQDYGPGEGSPLRSYLYRRQMDSILDRNHVKWVELSVNPEGARNREFYRWGLEKGGRLDELKRRIRAGEPVPLGLKSCGSHCSGDHVVLAVGYDVGTFAGEFVDGPTGNQNLVKIYIYNPNAPGRRSVLRADPVREVFYLEGDRSASWRSWFIADYSPAKPPLITRPSREVVVGLRTGGDDLRGGNDNVHIVLLSRNGREHRAQNVNFRKRWVNNSTNEVSIALPEGWSVDELKGLRLETTFGGGIGGDNWNLDWISARYHDASGRRDLLASDRASQSQRFTGSTRSREYTF